MAGEKRKGERRGAEAAYPEEGQTDRHTHRAIIIFII